MEKIKKILLLSLIALSTVVAQNQWEIISEMPTPVAGAVAVTYGNKIYIFGGLSDSLFTSLKSIQVYDPVTNTWETNKTMMKNRAFLFAASNQNGIYFGGGFAPTDTNYFVSYNTLEMFSPDNSASTEHSVNDIFLRSYTTAVMKDNWLFIIGGSSAVDTNFILRYNVQTLTIEKTHGGFKNGYPKPLGTMAVVADTNIYIFGGATEFVSNLTAKINLNLNYMDSTFFYLNEPRAFGVAVSLNKGKDIYLIGGLNEVSPALKSVEHISLSNDFAVSENIENLNIGRSDLSAAIYNNAIYVFGGYNKEGFVENSVEKLIIGPNAITQPANKVPKNFLLKQNYPNPFNPVTTIEYLVASKAFMRLNVFNILGKKVATLVNEIQNPGNYTVSWNATNQPSGIYFYTLLYKGKTITKKMILTK